MIIRVISVIVEALVLYLLQTSVFSSFQLAGVVPDLLIILVCAVAFMRGKIPAMLTGMLCGLLIDCSYNGVIGLCSLMYMLVGYLAGFSHKIYDENDYTFPLIIVSISELLYNFMYYVFFYLLSGKLNIGYYMYRFMVPRVIYTVLVSLVLYKLLNMCNVFFMRFDKD